MHTMLYTSGENNFQEHVHSNLQRRIRIFLIIGFVSLFIVVMDIARGVLGFPIALLSILVGAGIGFYTSRIFHLSWDRNGQEVVGRIDKVGWYILSAYILFEIARSILFADIIHTGYDATAITFSFISAALIARVLGLRGRIIKILKERRVFG